MPIPKRFHRHLFIFVGIILAVLLLVQPVSIADSSIDWGKPEQERQGWIDDRADLLDWQSELRLSLRINKLVGRTSAEFAIASLPKIATSESPRAFAIKLFNTLGVGKRETNNGVLLLVSKNDRRIEIVTGKGLSEVLPDTEISDLIQQEIVPSFQEQQYARGITQGVNAIAQRLELRLPSTILPNWMPMFFVWIPWFIAIGGAGWMIFVTASAIAEFHPSASAHAHTRF
ncbi:TPM domain-containing protein [Pseudanabaena mucicola]|uniref:TPM domain-containing protein n=1 Tax=Pseudanabaena mucicola FACHB-723 TaxID=2692860 RepID=A0ABR7ZVZ5_9CYAN|nr:TPM domain-containing protein [Pseudanabaena mucicola]MBD2188103.1 TPM domain-containing protein [Pseudanabaena mucicola FACHB-723]